MPCFLKGFGRACLAALRAALPALLFLFTLLPPAQAIIPGVVAQQRQAVVAVSVHNKQGGEVLSRPGFIIEGTGVIIAGCPVVARWFDSGNAIYVKTAEGLIYPIESLISERCGRNMALLSVRGAALPKVRLASNYKAKKGARVFIASFRPGKDDVTEGTISEVHKTGGSFDLSFSVPPERSGSPLFNERGEVIGIVAVTPGKGGVAAVTVVPVSDIIAEIKAHSQAIAKIARLRQLYPPPPPQALPDEVPAREVTEEMPSDPRSLFLRGCALEDTRRYTEAIESFRRAIALRPDFAEAHVQLGVTYYKLGRYEDAIAAYSEALRLKPDDQSVYIKIASSHIILEQHNLAISVLKQALYRFPMSPDLHFQLGLAYHLNNERAEAFLEYAALKKINPKMAERLLDLLN